MNTLIRILIADDDQLIREGLQAVLARQADIRVVAAVTNGREALEHCLGSSVDVALLDAKMPVMDGPTACAEIVERTDVRCCILSTFDDPDLVDRAVRAGASGYLLKGAAGEEIAQSLHLIAGGHTVFQSSVFAGIRPGSPASRRVADLSDLTEREQEIVRAVAEGLSNREISQRLYLSEGTVKNYISSILAKLGLKQRTQIAVYYLDPDSGR
jgi:DNA-binding NarL/FixJ family response regulator